MSCVEGKAGPDFVSTMAAIADIAMLVGRTQDDLMCPGARRTLANMVDAYHKKYPFTAISRDGAGVLGFVSEKAHALADAKRVAEETKRRELLVVAKILEAEEELAEQLKLSQARKDKLVLDKAKAVAKVQDADDARWSELAEMVKGRQLDDTVMMERWGMHAPGWVLSPYPENDKVCSRTITLQCRHAR